MSHTIELGAKARDRVSGWEGIATARYEYVNGCERYEVGGHDKDGKPESFVFDVQQLEVTEAPAAWSQPAPPASESAPPAAKRGGPRGSTPIGR